MLAKESPLHKAVKELSDRGPAILNGFQTHKNMKFNALSLEKALPAELIYSTARYLTLLDYIRLRKSCKIFSKLSPAPMLSFDKYKESTFIFGEVLTKSHRMHLDLTYFHEESFIFIVRSNHVHEFSRVLHSYKGHSLSADIIQEAMVFDFF